MSTEPTQQTPSSSPDAAPPARSAMTDGATTDRSDADRSAADRSGADRSAADRSGADRSGADLRAAFGHVRAEVGKAVVGQDGAVSGMIVGLLAQGHVLLEGVPGVAKTLLVRSLAASMSLDTKRIQFTPDLMPGDVTGSLVYDASSGTFPFREGPVFTNVLLADEVNRTPPKTQSALLEAMEERQVSVDGGAHVLPDPFFVAATMNPIEFEGTYTLPEAQLDRFLMKLTMDIPPRDVEFQVLRRHADGFVARDVSSAGIVPVIGVDEVRAAQRAVRAVGARDDVLAYVVDLARATREAPSVRVGVSPRGATALLAAAKAWAWITGSDAITPDHVQAMATPVWRHRLRIAPDAELEGVGADAVLRQVLQQVRVPI
ncbi:AAA family ATPase [Curtobacterium sp. RRHDQ10]|uniref:AAA family ATPase n=1 Tax=Curtobacterium phyllosphaerae TaxID=3413379 RepID=UPI003BF32A78